MRKINITQKKATKVMFKFKEGVLTSGKSDTIVTYRKQAFAIAERETKIFKK